jgi:hypothetical protein
MDIIIANSKEPLGFSYEGGIASKSRTLRDAEWLERAGHFTQYIQ